MLLIIRNLPMNTRYKKIKDLLYKLGFKEVILDNMLPDADENGMCMKVTIGLASEEDAAVLVRKINGYMFEGHQLKVEPLRQQASNQSYRDTPKMRQPRQFDNSTMENFAGSVPPVKKQNFPQTYFDSNPIPQQSQQAYTPATNQMQPFNKSNQFDNSMYNFQGSTPYRNFGSQEQSRNPEFSNNMGGKFNSSMMFTGTPPQPVPPPNLSNTMVQGQQSAQWQQQSSFSSGTSQYSNIPQAFTPSREQNWQQSNQSSEPWNQQYNDDNSFQKSATQDPYSRKQSSKDQDYKGGSKRRWEDRDRSPPRSRENWRQRSPSPPRNFREPNFEKPKNPEGGNPNFRFGDPRRQDEIMRWEAVKVLRNKIFKWLKLDRDIDPDLKAFFTEEVSRRVNEILGDKLCVEPVDKEVVHQYIQHYGMRDYQDMERRWLQTSTPKRPKFSEQIESGNKFAGPSTSKSMPQNKSVYENQQNKPFKPFQNQNEKPTFQKPQNKANPSIQNFNKLAGPSTTKTFPPKKPSSQNFNKFAGPSKTKTFSPKKPSSLSTYINKGPMFQQNQPKTPFQIKKKLPKYMDGDKKMAKAEKLMHIKEMKTLECPLISNDLKVALDSEIDTITNLIKTKVIDTQTLELKKYMDQFVDESLYVDEMTKLMKQHVAHRILNTGSKILSVITKPKHPNMEMLNEFLAKQGVISLLKNKNGRTYTVKVDTYENYDRLLQTPTYNYNDYEVTFSTMGLDPIVTIDNEALENMRRYYIFRQIRDNKFVYLLDKKWPYKMQTKKKKKKDKYKTLQYNNSVILKEGSDNNEIIANDSKNSIRTDTTNENKTEIPQGKTKKRKKKLKNKLLQDNNSVVTKEGSENNNEIANDIKNNIHTETTIEIRTEIPQGKTKKKKKKVKNKIIQDNNSVLTNNNNNEIANDNKNNIHTETTIEIKTEIAQAKTKKKKKKDKYKTIQDNISVVTKEGSENNNGIANDNKNNIPTETTIEIKTEIAQVKTKKKRKKDKFITVQDNNSVVIKEENEHNDEIADDNKNSICTETINENKTEVPQTKSQRRIQKKKETWMLLKKLLKNEAKEGNQNNLEISDDKKNELFTETINEIKTEILQVEEEIINGCIGTAVKQDLETTFDIKTELNDTIIFNDETNMEGIEESLNVCDKLISDNSLLKDIPRVDGYEIRFEDDNNVGDSGDGDVNLDSECNGNGANNGHKAIDDKDEEMEVDGHSDSGAKIDENVADNDDIVHKSNAEGDVREDDDEKGDSDDYKAEDGSDVNPNDIDLADLSPGDLEDY